MVIENRNNRRRLYESVQNNIDMKYYRDRKDYISMSVYCNTVKYNEESQDLSVDECEDNLSSYDISSTVFDFNNTDLWSWLQKKCDLLKHKKQEDLYISSYEDGRIEYQTANVYDSLIEDKNGEYAVTYSFYLYINDIPIRRYDLHKLFPNMKSY